MSWTTYQDFKSGQRKQLTLGRGHISMKSPGRGKARALRIGPDTYEAATWTSAWVTPGFAATSLVPSWEATTPGRSMVRVEVRGQTADGRRGSWDTIADWSTRAKAAMRTTHSGQYDDLGRVSADTWVATTPVTAWQLRTTLLRKSGSSLPISVERIGAVASRVVAPGPTSVPGPAVGTVLDVPAYSQMLHSGHYPQWGGGGEAWCSPTSTAMVLAYYGIAPTPRGIESGHPDAIVDFTAKMVYDHGYRGTGNWAFNTAYAATLVAGDSYVTRLPDLRAAEDFIAAGTPLVASIAFGPKQLTGAPISTSNGHLLVIVGFETDGDVVVNDPAAPSNAQVRRVYDRAEFERIWLAASNGTAYFIKNS